MEWQSKAVTFDKQVCDEYKLSKLFLFLGQYRQLLTELHTERARESIEAIDEFINLLNPVAFYREKE